MDRPLRDLISHLERRLQELNATALFLNQHINESHYGDHDHCGEQNVLPRILSLGHGKLLVLGCLESRLSVLTIRDLVEIRRSERLAQFLRNVRQKPTFPRFPKPPRCNVS